MAGCGALLGFGYWLVEERATGAFVGEVGLADFRRELEPGFGDAPEAGWVLIPPHRVADSRQRRCARPCAGRTRISERPLGRLHDRPRERALAAPRASRAAFVEYARTTYQGEPTLLLERVSRRRRANHSRQRLGWPDPAGPSSVQRLPPVWTAGPGIVPRVAQQVGLPGVTSASIRLAAWATSLAALSLPAPRRRVATISLWTA